ncbi:MAG: restriction endonuclease subunit S [Veillonella sp.]|nr:restriction endonuclease subunit S [Veillonella sp.]
MVKRLYRFPEVLYFQEGPGVRNHQYTLSGVKLLNVSNLRDGKIDLTTSNRYISEDEAFNKYSHFLCEPNDFIIASSGIKVDSFNNKMGFIHQSDLPVCMNTSTIRFKVLNKEVLEIRYFMYYLKSVAFKKVLTKVVTGSAQLNFGPSHLKNMSISLPNLDIQKEIVERLDRINKLLELKKKLLLLLDELIKSRFDELFLDTHAIEIIEIGELFEVGSSKRILQSELTAYGVPFYRVTDLINRINDKTVDIKQYVDEFKYMTLIKDKYVPQAGDFLITARGTIGKIYEVKQNDRFYFQDGMITWLKRKNNYINSLFFMELVKTDWFRRQFYSSNNGTTISYLSITDTRHLKVLLPSINLQKQFAQEVNQINKLKSDVQKSIDETQLLMDSLMQEYFG